MAGLPGVEGVEVGKFLQFGESGIGDFCAVEVEVFELVQSEEGIDSCIGNGGVFQAQAGEVFHSGQALQAGVGDFAAAEIEVSETM